jgi:hypothetical protein
VLENVLGGPDDAGSLLSLGGHHLRLEHVERVAREGAEGASEGARGELLYERRVLLGGAAEQDLARLVEAEAQGCVGGFTKPGGVDALPEGGDTLLGGDGANGTGDACGKKRERKREKGWLGVISKRKN